MKKQKPSKLFEGENSSLRKTYEDTISPVKNNGECIKCGCQKETHPIPECKEYKPYYEQSSPEEAQDSKCEKRAIIYDDLIKPEGGFFNLVYLDFIPQPLLPTYSFTENGKEIRYILKRSIIEKQSDKKWPFYLELVSPPRTDSELEKIDSKAFIKLPKNPTMKDFNLKWGVRIECTEYEELENDVLSLLDSAQAKGHAKGVIDESNHWMNQTANEHDNAIRSAALEEAIRAVKKLDYTDYIIEDIIDTLAALTTLKK